MGDRIKPLSFIFSLRVSIHINGFARAEGGVDTRPQFAEAETWTTEESVIAQMNDEKTWP